MALYWGFVVALVALNLGFSEAQSSITSTVASSNMTTTAVATSTNTPVGGGSASSVSSVAPVSTTTQIVATTTQTVATTTQIVATTTQTVATTTQIVATTTQIVATTTQTVATTTTTVVPTSSTSSPSGFYTYLIAGFKIRDNECPKAKDASLKSKFEKFYANPMFDRKNTTFKAIRNKCLFNFTFTFGPKLTIYNISEVFEDQLKRINNTVDTMVLTNIITYVNAPGVLGDFKVPAGACKKICCDGGPGGPITLNRTCVLPESLKCKIYKLEKVEQNCMDICSQECSGVTLRKISLLVLLLGVFMNWFLK